MKLLQRLPGIVCAFCLMIVFLITSVEAVTYWTPGYYEHEYEKYNVTAAVRMEMDDLLQVTDEMMDYLRGDRDDLHVMTVVDGSPREFFNAREIAHMEDVRGLFLGAITLRRVCLAAAAVCVLLMTALKADLKRTLPRMLCVGTGLFFLLAAGIGPVFEDRDFRLLIAGYVLMRIIMISQWLRASLGLFPVFRSVPPHFLRQ